MAYVWFFLKAIGYTLGALVICGLCVSLCRTVFIKMMGHGVGRRVILATSLLGTPIHELGHALMCLLFAHRITKMSLWQPASSDGTLGYVTHSYNPKNPYQVLGNLFIGIGPVFSGMGILMLALWLGFPASFGGYATAAASLAGEGDVLGLLAQGGLMLGNMCEELISGNTVPWWGRVLSLVVIFAVSQHISLSVDDIKGALRAIPLYLLLIAILTLICGLLGEGVMAAVTGGLALFSGYMTALFTVALAASLVQLVLALPVGIIRLVFSKH